MEVILGVVGVAIAAVSALLAWLQWQRPRPAPPPPTSTATSPSIPSLASTSTSAPVGAAGAAAETGPAAAALPDGRAPERQRPWMVPATGAVVDRPELVAALAEHLVGAAGDGAGAACVTVEGAGGVGKTILAAVVCRREDVRRRYPGGLVWVTVGEQAAGAELADLANGVTEALTGARPSTSDPMWAGAALGEALDRRPDTLLVLDDVWSASQVAPFLLGGAASRRLVTTRNRGVAPAGTPSVVVDTMSPDQAAAVLQMGLDRPLAPASLAPLLARTGRWPVLLGLVNAAIHDRVADGATPEQAAGWLADRLRRAGPTALDVGNDATRHGAVASTIAASLDQLRPAERELYWLLAIFPEDVDVPADVLALLWQDGGDLAGSAADAVRERLVRLRLVIGRWVGDQPAIRVHDVIRDYLRRRMSAEQRARAHRRFLDAARATVLVASGAGSSPAATPWWELPATATYLWRFVPWHLQQAGDDDELTGLLTDLRWTTAKVEALGAVGAVETDLALADTGTRTDDGTDAATIRALRRAIARNAHVLLPLEPGNGLGATLASRLAAVPELDEIARAFTATLARPHLTSRWPLPDLPAESARRILTGPSTHRSWVMACAVSPSGDLIASAGMDGTIRLWRTGTWDVATVLTGHVDAVHDCAFTPDGASLVSAGADGTVRLWDPGPGQQRRVLDRHAAPITRVCLTPDGGAVVWAGEDGAAHVVDLATGRRRTQLAGHTGAVTGCAVAPDGGSIVTTGADGTVRQWDAATGGLLHTDDRSSPLTSCAIAPDGRLVATTTEDGIWSLCELPGLRHLSATKGHRGPVAACAFSPDAALVATAGHDEQVVRVWDVATARRLEALVGHPGYVRDCTFTPDGGLVVSAGADQTTVWSLSGTDRDDTRARHRGWVRGCAASPDGRWFATGGDDHVLRLWDADSGAPVLSLYGHSESIRGCAFSPDGARLASVGDDRTVRTWALPEGKGDRVLRGHDERVMGCSFSPDGRWLASGSQDRTVRIWDAHTGEVRHVLAGHEEMVNAAAFSPDGALLATAGVDRTVRLWDVGAGRVEAVLHGHDDWVNACAFTGDGRHLVTGSGDGTACLWDVLSRQLVRRLSGHTHWIRGCALAPDDRWLATTSADRTIRIWDLATGRCVTALRVGARLTTCCWVDDSTIGVAGDAGVYVFTLHPGEG